MEKFKVVNYALNDTDPDLEVIVEAEGPAAAFLEAANQWPKSRLGRNADIRVHAQTKKGGKDWFVVSRI